MNVLRWVTSNSILSLAVLVGTTTRADAAATLDELLSQVRTGYKQESAGFKERVTEFKRARDQQAGLLARAKRQLADLEKASETLEREFEENERLLAEAEETLRARLGNMGELFGVIRQVAGDTRAQLASSVVSAQHKNRDDILAPLAESESLPSIGNLERLWFMLQQEMTETGKVSRFPTTIVSAAGAPIETEVVRVGAFNATANGKYLTWNTETEQLNELGRQPPAHFRGTASDLEGSQGGLVRFALDPSRGRILDVLIETPSTLERIQLGGPIGNIVIGLGILAALIGIVRFVMLMLVNTKIQAQFKTKKPGNNPLGRILSVYHDNPSIDTESLELKMDEAIIRETAQLERWIWVVKVVSVAAPLLGLLGTVVGMIQTFQAITLFGTGDPKLMAGGISVALVTTMLGLSVAIPLVLLYALLSSVVRRMTNILEEQSTGLIALSAEQARAAAAGGADQV